MASSVNWVGNYRHVYRDSDMEISMVYRLSDNRPPDTRTAFHLLFNNYTEFYSDNETEFPWEVETAIVGGLGSVKIESKKETEVPMQCFLEKKQDSSDDHLTIIFNETELDSLDFTAKSILSLDTFPLESSVYREGILPFSDNTVKLSIQACSSTSPVFGVARLRPHFRQLEVDLKPTNPSEVEERIVLVEAPGGFFNASIHSRVFDCFRISIHSLK